MGAKNSDPVITLKSQALAKLQKYCTYRERCHTEVRSKLLSLKIYGDDLEEIMSELIVKGFLSEERYAKSYVRGKFRINQWGKNKIISGLKFKRIPPVLIDIALKEIDEDDYRETLLEILSKKATRVKDSDMFARKQKLIKYAMGRGYELALIQQVLEELLNNYVDNRR